MKVLGLDPGLSTTGFGLIENSRMIDAGVIRPKGKKSLTEKIELIATELEIFVRRQHPVVCGLETVFYKKNPRSVILSAQLRGALILVLVRHGINILEFTPAHIKLALTGNGHASKAQVQYMVNRIFKINKKLSTDATDALAIAYCAAKI